MARVLKWDDATGTGGGTGNQREYLRIEPNIEYRLRPVGFPVEFERFYVRDSEGKLHSAIAGKPDECPIRNKYELEPTKRYAMNMIDRADCKLKIVEFPFTVYQEMKKWGKNTHQEPGGKNGNDFLIKKTGSGIKGTKWHCEANPDSLNTPWTQEDKKILDKESGGGVYDLREIYAATPIDKIEEKLGLVVGHSGPVEEGNVDSVNTVENDLEDGGVDSDFVDNNEPNLDF